MYKINLSQVKIAEIEKENEALSLAMNYHFTMNTSHELFVYDENDTLVCTLIRQ